jgi:hypothetical protein
MTILKHLVELFGIVLLVLCIFGLAKRRKLAVKFSTRDELEAFTSVVASARQQIGLDDLRWKAISILYAYFVRSALTGMTFVALARISAEDLEILAPFIDQFIEGKGPPPTLSAEYEDWQPAVLNGFKERMKAERLWPENNRHEPATSSGSGPIIRADKDRGQQKAKPT